jgi:hypothetical protein
MGCMQLWAQGRRDNPRLPVDVVPKSRRVCIALEELNFT